MSNKNSKSAQAAVMEVPTAAGHAKSEPDTLAQQVDLLYESSLASQLFVLLASALFVLLSWDAAPPGFLIVWECSFVAITVSRIGLVWFYRRHRMRLATVVWRDLFAVGAGAAGAAWGLASAILLDAPDPMSQIMVVFVVAGLVAAGVPYLAPVPVAVYAFVVPALLPGVLHSFGTGDQMHRILSVMIVFFGAAMIVVSRYINGQMVLTFKLRNENLGLVDYLSSVNRRMVTVNAQLTSEIGERKEIENNLQYVATHDDLTGLPNRKQFLKSLRFALQKAARHDRKLGIFFIDIDRFKNINDTLGHHAGDRVLVEIAGRIASSIREADIVGRLGGDEFVVLIEEIRDADDCARVASKVLEAISGAIYVIDGRQLHVTASIGISTFPTDGTDTLDLLKNADIAMYRAKEARGSAFEYYSAETNRHSIERLSLEADMREALAGDQFRIAYQPKFRLSDDALVGFEALLRWEHPSLGLIPPASFIPLAEESGLIVPIGERILGSVCAQVAAWHAEGRLGRDFSVAVNISPRQFGDPRLLDQVVSALTVSGLPGRFLEVEITEGAVMYSVDRAMRVLTELRARNIQVSIDDFGTGHSSLSYLKRFPISAIKIDKSFIDELPDNEDDAAITRTIIAMAHNLRLKAVAEGVETAAQLAFLRVHGCDEVQGYHTGRPMFATDFVLEFSEGSGQRLSSSGSHATRPAAPPGGVPSPMGNDHRASLAVEPHSRTGN